MRLSWDGHTVLQVLVYFERMNKQVAKSNEAVIYTRLSVARAGDTETLEDQERVCREMAERHGLRVVAVFAEGAGAMWHEQRDASRRRVPAHTDFAWLDWALWWLALQARGLCGG